MLSGISCLPAQHPVSSQRTVGGGEGGSVFTARNGILRPEFTRIRAATRGGEWQALESSPQLLGKRVWSHLLLGDQGHIFRLLGTPRDALWGHLAEKGPLYLLYRFSQATLWLFLQRWLTCPQSICPNACHLPAWRCLDLRICLSHTPGKPARVELCAQGRGAALPELRSAAARGLADPSL